MNALNALLNRRALQVYIEGPASVEPYSTNTWLAVASYGSPPYTYRWYWNGQFVGTGATYTAQAGEPDFQLRVEVTDAAAATVSAGGTILVSCVPTTDPACPI